ncbi:MAG: hypothetical protein ACK5MN_07560 [Lachnospiraceae bacterium]
MEKIIFTKYSNERSRRFSLRTDILSDEQGARRVFKKNTYPEGKGHIAGIHTSYEALSRMYQDTRIVMNRCEQQEGGISLEYLEGVTLEHILSTCLLEGRTDTLIQLLLSYIEEVSKGHVTEPFKKTPQFLEVFGDVELPEGLLCAPVTDIDMVLGNVIVQEDTWTLIDYEWSFAFPVPMRFVLYRILHYFEHSNLASAAIRKLGLMAKVGITAEEIQAYKVMEQNFQERYILSESTEQTHVPIRNLYPYISPGSLDVRHVLHMTNAQEQRQQIQLFESDRMHFEEGQSIFEPSKEGQVIYTLSPQKTTRYVRLDPCSQACCLQNLSIRTADEQTLLFETNGVSLDEFRWFFFTTDPQILFELPEGVRTPIQITYEIHYMEEAVQQQVERLYNTWQTEQQHTAALSAVIDEKDAVIQQRDELIRNMEQTKIWKAYRKYKDVTSKEKSEDR